MRYSDVLREFQPAPEVQMGHDSDYEFDREKFFCATKGFIKNVRISIGFHVIILLLLLVALLILVYFVMLDSKIIVSIIGGNGLIAGFLVRRIVDLDKQRFMALWVERVLPFADNATIQKIIERTVQVPGV